MRLMHWFAVVLLTATSLGIARADDKTSFDDQFMAVGLARTRADLAVRKLKIFFDENDPAWRSVSARADGYHARTLEAIKRAADDETKKPDDLRDPAILDALAQKRADIEQNWLKFSTVDQPNLEAIYKNYETLLPGLTQIFNAVVALDSLWKDARLDLGPLQADYDAVGNRATDARDAAQKALTDLRQAEKSWQKTAEAATRPSGADAGK